MEVAHASPVYSEIPSLVDSLPSDQVSELTNTEESFDLDDWSSLSPTVETRDRYAGYHYQYHHHHHQQQQQQYHHQQPAYQPMQYGYMTPTPPYNGTYYMPSPPVDYSHYHYEPQQRVAVGVPSPSGDGYNCEICAKTFKSAANLSRHFMSKTHQKRLQSRKANATRQKKQKLGSVLTDLSDEEKRFLWQLDDEICLFLLELEAEKAAAKKAILPTPPLSPNQRKRELERLRELEDERIYAEIIEEVDCDEMQAGNS